MGRGKTERYLLVPLPFGKLDHDRLARMLAAFGGPADPAVLVGPRVGLDAAVLEIGGQKLVTATDPITFATDRIGWYAVQVNANDVAVMGAEPRWMQVCLLLPPCEEDQVASIFRDLHEAASKDGIALVGGHTEITHGLDRPVVVTTMMGLAERLLTSADAQEGDALLLTKGVALEGAAVLAREVVEGGSGRTPLVLPLASEVVRRAAGYLDDPGISVVAEARLAVRHAAHALHDPTEGGLVTGIWEMAEAAGLGVEVDLDRVPVLPEADALCRAYGLDVFRTLASGALLIACPAESTEALLAALEQHTIAATQIGRFVRGSRTLRTGGRVAPLEPSAQDELTKVFQ